VRIRRYLAIAGLTLAVAMALVAWAAWSDRATRQDGRLALTLRVNLQSRTEIVPGAPLVFDVTLTSSPSSAGFTVGSRWRPWHELIRLEDPHGRLSWPLTPLGLPRSLSRARQTDGRPSVTTHSSPIARLESGRHVHVATQAAVADVTTTLRPGIYRIRAVLETPFWLRWGWRGRVTSTPVTIVVRDPATLGQRAAALENERLRRTAALDLALERFDAAERAARQLVERQASDVEARLLLGDALAGLNRRREALAEYQRALTAASSTDEEPLAIYDRMQRVIATMVSMASSTP
jgi:hypothetical protein